MTLQINDQEMILLSDTVFNKQIEIADELAIREQEIANLGGGADADLDNLLIEIRQDFALCSSILEKINAEING